jgi:AraC-like DNA-binding protein
MQPAVNIFAIFFLLGAAQGVFLAVALLTIKGGNRLANRIFAILLMVWALPLLTAAAYRSNYILSFPHLMKNEVPLIFVYGPLFFLYVKALTLKRFAFKKGHLLHFIPFVIDVGYLLPFYLQSSAEKINFWTNLPPGHGPMRSDPEEALGVCHVLVYSFLTIRLLVNHGRAIKESFSSIEKINLAWIRNLLIGFSAVWAFHLVFVMSGFRVSWFFPIMGLVIVSMIFYMGFKALTQPEIFATDEERQTVPKYAKTALAPEKADTYLEKLLSVIEAEKLFTDSDLSLQKLAKKLAIPIHHLSQIINERLQKNFFEFVNGYRVEEAKKLLADPAKKHLNIAEIGFSVGFNSLSTFNAAFKNHAQMTPSLFRKQASIMS